MDIFTLDKVWVLEAKNKYRAGQIGDVECKKKLIESIVALLEPMHKRRKEYAGNEDYILSVIRDGAARANAAANQTLSEAKKRLMQLF